MLYALYQQHPQVYIDTRNAPPNGIFFAVGQKDAKGYHRGNAFALTALAQCQAAYVVVNDKELYEANAHDPRWIWVEDGEVALQALARQHRQSFRLPVLAVVGSNGKTTTRQLIHAVLSQRYRVFSTPGNLNNHLGVPLSILSIRPLDYDIIVLEIGANHLEETFHLAQIAMPTHGIITNCGKDHLGEYGSLDNIVRANCELYDFLRQSGGMAFVHQGDPILFDQSGGLAQRFLYGEGSTIYGRVTGAPMLQARIHTPEGETEIKTRLFGSFWIDSVVATVAIGTFWDIRLPLIRAAIEAYQPASLRSQWVIWRGNEVLLDCYNANPSSMASFVKEVQQFCPSDAVLVLGEMLELGDFSRAEHVELLAQLQPERFSAIAVVGRAFEGLPLPSAVLHFATTLQARAWLHALRLTGQQVFIKGSRGNKLESLLESPDGV